MVFFSCKSGDGNSGPHLPRDVMQKVLLDVNLAEAYCISVKDSLHRPGAKNIDSLSAFYKQIFDHYKITEDEFNSSLTWYKYHPAELDSIYAKLIPVVTTWQSRMPPATIPQQAMPAPGAQMPMMHPLPTHNAPAANAATATHTVPPSNKAAGILSKQN